MIIIINKYLSRFLQIRNEKTLCHAELPLHSSAGTATASPGDAGKSPTKPLKTTSFNGQL